MGIRVRMHWFDKAKALSVDREYSADLGGHNAIFKSIGLSVDHNVNNGNFPVEKHWVTFMQPLFYHWIDLEHYDYQVAFDYKDKWNINEHSLRGRNVMTMQFISVDELAGIPLPYPLATPPAGWFICQGQVFDKTKYPKLAHCYPTGRLPDLRGEFIRGWDNARGADTGRLLLSSQSESIQSHTHSGGVTGPSAGKIEGWGDGAPGVDNYQLVRTGATGGNETRPRNIAFNYIVRAI